jgi:hypothetical protein
MSAWPFTIAARRGMGGWLWTYLTTAGRRRAPEPGRPVLLRDSDGRPPRHSFFYPAEEYEPEHLDALTDLCRAGLGEVEVHLHHDNDTADNLRRTLTGFRDLLIDRHGQLARHRRTGEPAYAFIHGNWAPDNSRPDGRWCGVTNALDGYRRDPPTEVAGGRDGARPGRPRAGKPPWPSPG